MIPKKYRVEIGTYIICKKGKAAFTLAAPRAWLIYSGAQLGDECIAFTDKRDNSLHYDLKRKTQPRGNE